MFLRSRRSLGLCLLLGLILTTGCGGGKSGSGTTVTGKVTLEGQPVNGIVHFVHATAPEATAPSGPDGYTMINPPLGQVKVLVKAMPGAAAPGAATPKGSPELPSMAGTSTAQGVAPPAKYGHPGTSDITYEVKAGKQTFDIPLKR